MRNKSKKIRNQLRKILSKHRLLNTCQVWELHKGNESREKIEHHLWELVKRGRVETIEYPIRSIKGEENRIRLWGLPGRLPRLSDISEYIQTSISKEDV